MKVLIFITSLVCIVASIIGINMLGGFGLILQCPYHAGATQPGVQQCANALATNIERAGSSLTTIEYIAAGSGLVAWLLGVLSTIANRRWGLLILIILFAPWSLLFYGAFGGDGSVFDTLLGGKGANRVRWGQGGGQSVASNNSPGFDTLPASVQPGRCWQCGGQVRLNSRICLNCGATQANYEVGPSAAAQASGYDRDATAGGYAPEWQPTPASSAGWTPPPGYQQPGQPPAMAPDYQQQSGYGSAGYPPAGYGQSGYQQPGYQQPGQPPAPGGPGWGQGY